MKVVILAGGYGTRISEESIHVPKPMVQIGDKPILWHIMKMYSQYGFNDFVILGGYKCYVIKEYFANYFLHQSDFTIDLAENKLEIFNSKTEPWKVTILDTGLDTLTGGRLKRAEKYLNEESFMLTYGDGVSDVNIDELLRFHKKNGKMLTITAVQPEGRFGALDIEHGTDKVINFMEKPKSNGAWINGGYFVCEPPVFNYIDNNDQTIWERSPLEAMSRDGEIYAFKHHGFWKPMDVLRDKIQLEGLWNNNKAPWKIWK